MFKFDEPVEQGAIVRVIGVGTFGHRIVGNMVGCIHQVECVGVVTKGSAEPDNLPLVSLSLNSNQDHHDVAPLLEKLGTPDLVFIVTNLDEEDGLLKDICTALHNGNIPTFLVIPESARTTKRMTRFPEQSEEVKVALDGVIIVSESSMEPPYPAAWEDHYASSLQDNLFQLTIRHITDLLTFNNMMGIDFVDVTLIICGGLTQFGAGIASGDGRAAKAAEKAIACLRDQNVELRNMTRALHSLCGSDKMGNDDYNSSNNFLHEQFNDECNHRLGMISDNSFGDSLLVSVMAVYEPPEELVFPRWVKLYDKYDRIKKIPSRPCHSIIFDTEEGV